MRSSIVTIVAAFASLAYAQSLNGLPACARTCVIGFTSGSQIGNCPSLDVKCICSNADFLSGIACCLAASCDAADQAAAVQFAQQICLTAGVTVPSQVVCSSTTTSGSTAATGSSASSASVQGSSTTAAPATTSAVTQSSNPSTASSSSASSTSAKANAAAPTAACAGMGIAGGLAAMLALL